MGTTDLSNDGECSKSQGACFRGVGMTRLCFARRAGIRAKRLSQTRIS